MEKVNVKINDKEYILKNGFGVMMDFEQKYKKKYKLSEKNGLGIIYNLINFFKPLNIWNVEDGLVKYVYTALQYNNKDFNIEFDDFKTIFNQNKEWAKYTLYFFFGKDKYKNIDNSDRLKCCDIFKYDRFEYGCEMWEPNFEESKIEDGKVKFEITGIEDGKAKFEITGKEIKGIIDNNKNKSNQRII